MSQLRRLLPVVILGLAILAPAGLVEAKTHHTASAQLVAKTKKKHHKKKHHKKHKKHTKTTSAKTAKSASITHA